MQILLIVLVLIAVYLWAKYSFFRVDLSRNLEVFHSRGAPLVKRSKFQSTEKKPQKHFKADQEALEQMNHTLALTESLQKPVPTEAARISKPKLPEDSMLRRHFTNLLKAEIEVKLGSKPTDSCLARHYEAMVQAEIAKALAGEIEQ